MRTYALFLSPSSYLVVKGRTAACTVRIVSRLAACGPSCALRFLFCGESRPPWRTAGPVRSVGGQLQWPADRAWPPLPAPTLGGHYGGRSSYGAPSLSLCCERHCHSASSVSLPYSCDLAQNVWRIEVLVYPSSFPLSHRTWLGDCLFGDARSEGRVFVLSEFPQSVVLLSEANVYATAR